MKPLVRTTLCLAALVLATGCYVCRQDYNPHTGMHYQCRQFGISLLGKKGCCGKDGQCAGQCADQGGSQCEGGFCAGQRGATEGWHEGYMGGGEEYMSGEYVPQHHYGYDQPYIVEDMPVESQSAPMQQHQGVQPPPAPATETNWQPAPPKAPPVSAMTTGYPRAVRLQ